MVVSFSTFKNAHIEMPVFLTSCCQLCDRIVLEITFGMIQLLIIMSASWVDMIFAVGIAHKI